MAGIGKSIAKKIDAFLNPNGELTRIFLKMGNLTDSVRLREAYWKASDILKTLPDKIKYGYQVQNMDGFTKSICVMIDEFENLGFVKRLEELKSKKYYGV